MKAMPPVLLTSMSVHLNEHHSSYRPCCVSAQKSPIAAAQCLQHPPLARNEHRAQQAQRWLLPLPAAATAAATAAAATTLAGIQAPLAVAAANNLNLQLLQELKPLLQPLQIGSHLQVHARHEPLTTQHLQMHGTAGHSTVATESFSGMRWELDGCLDPRDKQSEQFPAQHKAPHQRTACFRGSPSHAAAAVPPLFHLHPESRG